MAEPWLLLDIYDSDITTVTYGPPGPGSGVGYLGVTPRIYFEDPSASEPTNADREAAGLAAWWGGFQPGADGAARAAKATELRTFLASDNDPVGEEEEGDPDDDLDDADVFVEIKAGRFVRALGLPVPDGLPE